MKGMVKVLWCIERKKEILGYEEDGKGVMVH